MGPAAGWTQETTGTEVAEAFKSSLKGKTVLITGVSLKSLGESTAVVIARHGPAKLILASRTEMKLQQVADEIVKINPDVKAELIVVNLSSQADIRTAARRIIALTDRPDLLINNAAVVTSARGETLEGIELQFGTNHIGHHLLTSLLTPLLLAEAEASGTRGTTRIVNVSSMGYRLSPIRFHDYSFEGKPVPPEEEPPAGIPAHMKPDVGAGRPYYGFTAYGQSKTANILHAVALKERLSSKGVQAFAVHPGSIWTDLSRNLSDDDRKIIEGTSTFWKNQDQGCAPTLAAAFDPDISRESST
ncbi:hypothetical protein LTR35_011097 [Friedmanniomyces endolithicus]|uniref:NAD(P)-binding protein n=1 Tax=Friedmanniomyces endolithicus TaxID=329885 RepID=A0AAN6FSM9_9PEZI|nr:hypothetical protein LTR35_011097 [Friedmanniomyces endolithicus]KAK0277298.1 hypothetical protein LTS00_014271 [Friedmanniomyces endolithicus]KAK0323724.1 hypothetical protein LTR82_005471 [Friedmanniomyces endolithicus]KAK1018998.1 hypothetical protein LTR54_000811 [Friedmanniomyces endolithicus]